jgi:hypothetical protein
MINEAVAAEIDAMSESDLFNREPGAYALRYVGKTDHDIMLYALRELLNMRETVCRLSELYARPEIIQFTPPVVETLDRNTAESSRSES